MFRVCHSRSGNRATFYGKLKNRKPGGTARWSNLDYQEMVPPMLNRRRILFTSGRFYLEFSGGRAQQPFAPVAPKEDYVRAHYTKYEFRIPMRDGARLFTAVYVPKDADSGPYPFPINRTPYDVGSRRRGQASDAPWPFGGV